ncbi:hypothetical protein [Legionella israelensis]|uniref:Uncharacterized protein n=1 Tax=Legionella israelensis TaxID=454 RepID=A0A0W0VTZ6_9GAMM|nr:hypothetical protein [Legionella israelensis]KTD23490.1 hypothetical protein Lisr_1420 [Legionella israelensis]QBS09023.1 hypothetical protein E4T55_03630 [Legionella israelensis]STX58731.1 Uncharacterised protein [Legionella israelensis]
MTSYIEFTLLINFLKSKISEEDRARLDSEIRKVFKETDDELELSFYDKETLQEESSFNSLGAKLSILSYIAQLYTGIERAKTDDILDDVLIAIIIASKVNCDSAIWIADFPFVNINNREQFKKKERHFLANKLQFQTEFNPIVFKKLRQEYSSPNIDDSLQNEINQQRRFLEKENQEELDELAKIIFSYDKEEANTSSRLSSPLEAHEEHEKNKNYPIDVSAEKDFSKEFTEEVIKIQQQIDVQIKKLKKSIWNPFLGSPEAKIKALYLLKDFFNSPLEKAPNADNIGELIDAWKESRDYFRSKNKTNVSINAVLTQHRNIFFSDRRDKLTSTEEFIDNLFREFKDRSIYNLNNKIQLN